VLWSIWDCKREATWEDTASDVTSLIALLQKEESDVHVRFRQQHDARASYTIHVCMQYFAAVVVARLRTRGKVPRKSVSRTRTCLARMQRERICRHAHHHTRSKTASTCWLACWSAFPGRATVAEPRAHLVACLDFPFTFCSSQHLPITKSRSMSGSKFANHPTVQPPKTEGLRPNDDPARAAAVACCRNVCNRKACRRG